MLRGDIRDAAGRGPGEPAPGAPDCAIVVCHGFKGFKDWGFFPGLCDELAVRVGCPVIGYNVSGSGIGPELGSFSDPEAFAGNTYSREVADLESVLDGIETGRLGNATLRPASRIGLVGHSRGAIPVAVAGPGRPGVAAIVTWAGLARPDRVLDLFPPGDTRPAEVRNARTGEVLPLRRDIVEDWLANAGRLDPVAALVSGGRPLLVIHGAADEAVPLDDARALAAAPNAELRVIEGTGHTFDARHPFTGSTPALERAMTWTANHFRAHLPKER